ncbi:Spindle and kinetochore-associated protein 1 [Halocaridina rubra]|uniref:SKA complex subunit 1 n=1 Tax=Halocaridina rubra TaxID=373956 RepID=A0AAN8ZVS6_HALRR
MPLVDTLVDIGPLEECLHQKVSALKISMDIRGGWGEDTVGEIEDLNRELESMRSNVNSLKETVTQAKRDLASAYALLKRLQELSCVALHMKENLPRHLPSAGASCHKGSKEKAASNNAERQEKASKTGCGKSKKIQTIQYISINEFESISKYIRGRLQYEQINNAINELNKAIETKYALMSRPRAKISEFDMRIVTSCRHHENKETKGLYFVVDSDIKRWSNMRLDTAGRTILTILRTLKRLREIRGPGNLIRYVAL